MVTLSGGQLTLAAGDRCYREFLWGCFRFCSVSSPVQSHCASRKAAYARAVGRSCDLMVAVGGEGENRE
jgi:hypothetical protein